MLLRLFLESALVLVAHVSAALHDVREDHRNRCAGLLPREIVPLEIMRAGEHHKILVRQGIARARQTGCTRRIGLTQGCEPLRALPRALAPWHCSRRGSEVCGPAAG